MSSDSRARSQAWRDAWTAAPREVRHEVEKRVASGRPMATADHAALAIGCARRWRRRALVGYLLFAPLAVLAQVIVVRVMGDALEFEFTATVLLVAAAATAVSVMRSRRAEAVNIEAMRTAPLHEPDRARSPLLEAMERARKTPPPMGRPGGAAPKPRDRGVTDREPLR